MGTLFAIQEAAGGNADALLLMNPPLRLRLTRRLFVTPLKIAAGHIKADDRITLAARDACGVAVDANPLHYIRWIPRYLELFAEIRRTRLPARHINVPAHVFVAERDEMVSPSVVDMISGNCMKVEKLQESGHYYYTPTDMQRMHEALNNLCRCGTGAL